MLLSCLIFIRKRVGTNIYSELLFKPNYTKRKFISFDSFGNEIQQFISDYATTVFSHRFYLVIMFDVLLFVLNNRFTETYLIY